MNAGQRYAPNPQVSRKVYGPYWPYTGTPKARSREDTHPGRISTAWNVETLMGSDEWSSHQ
jgi:hypothetical protein